MSPPIAAQEREFSTTTHLTKEYTQRLPLLRFLEERFLDRYGYTLSFEDTAIVYVHHALETSVDLLVSLFHLGAQPKNIFVLGKCYSDSPSVIKQIRSMGVHHIESSYPDYLGGFSESFERDVNSLWGRVYQEVSDRTDVKSFIVADHGGYAVSAIPKEITDRFRVIGVEKTAGGISKIESKSKPSIPVIDMARCVVKKKLESPLIADAIAKKIPGIITGLKKRSKSIVAGYGAIGVSVAGLIMKQGGNVLICDPNKGGKHLEGSAIHHLGSDLPDRLDGIDFVFGCSGNDVTKNLNVSEIAQDVTFVSCSSGDVEFLSLLKFIGHRLGFSGNHDCMGDIVFKTDAGGILTIIRGGFPVNFDHSGESVAKDDIQLTRGLALSAIVQAALLLSRHNVLLPAFYSLDGDFQGMVADKWLSIKRYLSA